VQAAIVADKKLGRARKGETKEKLTERETLLRDMRALRESIDFDKIEMVSGNWKATEREGDPGAHG
jgi:hypothetical protein